MCFFLRLLKNKGLHAGSFNTSLSILAVEGNNQEQSSCELWVRELNCYEIGSGDKINRRKDPWIGFPSIPVFLNQQPNSTHLQIHLNWKFLTSSISKVKIRIMTTISGFFLFLFFIFIFIFFIFYFKSTSSRFLTIFSILKKQKYFLLSYKKTPHNRFSYLSLYQLNIIFLLLFYSFFLFPTFSLFLISIKYTFFILK
jgi:hypothetical protein